MFLAKGLAYCLCNKPLILFRVWWQTYHVSFLVSHLLRFPFLARGQAPGLLLHILMRTWEYRREMAVFLSLPEKAVPFSISRKVYSYYSFHLPPLHSCPLKIMWKVYSRCLICFLSSFLFISSCCILIGHLLLLSGCSPINSCWRYAQSPVNFVGGHMII